MAEKSRREILEEAFTDDEEVDPKPEGEEGAAQVSAATDGTGEEQPAALEGADGVVKEGKVDEQKPAQVGKEKPGKEAKALDPDKQERQAAVDKKPPTVTDKAPNSWKPLEREGWAKIPAEQRAAITRREMEIQRELSQTANIRKFSGDLARVLQPHMNYIQTSGSNPLAAIDSLMKTASGLMGGTTETKASLVAQIIQNYGVDIKTLDAILSKQPIPQGGQNQPNPNAIPQWAQPIFGFMNQAQAAKQQRELQMAHDALAEIESVREVLPFFEDLRQDIADLMETAANRGKVLSLQDAYKKAAALDPEISKVLAQRSAAQKQNIPGGAVARARKAASTISGAPNGAASGSKGKAASRKDAIREAWDSAEA